MTELAPFNRPCRLLSALMRRSADEGSIAFAGGPGGPGGPVGPIGPCGPSGPAGPCGPWGLGTAGAAGTLPGRDALLPAPSDRNVITCVSGGPILRAAGVA